MRKFVMFALLMLFTMPLSGCGCGGPGANTSSPEGLAESYVNMKNYYDQIGRTRGLASMKISLEQCQAELPFLREDPKKIMEKRIKNLENEIKFNEENSSKLSKFVYTFINTSDTNDSNIKIVTFKIEGNGKKLKKKDKEDEPNEWELEEMTVYGYIKAKKEADSWKLDGSDFAKKQEDLDNLVKYVKESIK